MITLDKIKATKEGRKKRVGRGDASGKGKTCGRGTKGQKARSKIRLGFEGGQMPLSQRIPKRKGFSNIFQRKFSVLNVLDLEKNFKEGEKVNQEVLLKKGLVKRNRPVKILGDGELKKVLAVEAQAFSRQAKKKIEGAKGKAIVVRESGKKRVQKSSLGKASREKIAKRVGESSLSKKEPAKIKTEVSKKPIPKKVKK